MEGKKVYAAALIGRRKSDNSLDISAWSCAANNHDEALGAALKAAHRCFPDDSHFARTATAALVSTVGPAAGVDLTAPSRWLESLRAGGGPDLTEFAHRKLAHEAQELASEPEQLSELADVLICAAGLMLRNGWTVEQVNAAVEQKTSVNAARVWERAPDGTWQHREEAPPVATDSR